ncbi:MAG: AraC family transcriptional regulator, partial [Sneathiella sp.]
MTNSKKIILIGYDGCQLLDITGPASVFSMANKVAGEDIYSVLIASPVGRPIETDSGVTLQSQPLSEIEATPRDTILVAGADTRPLSRVMKNKMLLSWLVSKETTVARLSSVCSGSFILARAGLLKKRAATTHWLGCDRLAQDYPDIQVDKDALFVKDGKVWTSAGVTTGIDMALVMVEQDLTAQIANDIARRLVLYARRPGHQSQFSSLLQAQSKAGEAFRPLIDWMKSNLDKSLDIPHLA